MKKSAPVTPVAPPRDRQRPYLYLTAAVNGAAIMIIEILGAKMLSPYFGMSHFVWTAQIAVTLVALACGYYAGGRIADRVQRLPVLYWAILGAAAYLALAVNVCEPISYWCLDFNLAVGSLLASLLLFFLPLALLAMTGPFLARIITRSLEGVGGSVGRLTAISTLGSFAGTLFIGYVMIPLLPNSVTMYATALALMLLAIIYFVSFHRRSAAAITAAVFVSMVAGGALYIQQHRTFAWVREQFRGNSNFGMLEVFENADATSRYYLNDNLIQNTYDPVRKQSQSTFTYMLSRLGRAYVTNVADVLCIGLGVGIVPMEFANLGARVDVVEINPAVVPVAERYFDLDPAKMNLTIDDGRHFLNRCRKQYDVVVLDAFLGDSSPSHLLTKEAFGAIRRVLRPDGVLVINSFGDLDPGRDFFTASLAKTLQAAFTSVKLHTSNNGAMFFVASPRAQLAFAHPPELADVHPRAKSDTEAAVAGVTDPPADRGRVLRDDYNPVEYYDAKNREEIRRRLALSAREM